jgi:hypothetical protein
MKHIFTLILGLLLSDALAGDLVSIDHARIAELATSFLQKEKPEIKIEDLKAELINVVSHPESTEKNKANIEVEFIILSSEKMKCEPPAPEFVEFLKKNTQEEIPKELCVRQFNGYRVSFNSLNPKGTYKVRDSGIGYH